MRPTDSQQVVPTSLMSSARNKLMTTSNLLRSTQPMLVWLEQLAANLLPSSTLYNNLFQTCHNNWEQAVRTHPDIGLTICLQIYNNLCRAFTDTRKNAQVVTNLQQTCSNAVPTTCQQDVFALLVPSFFTSCQRLVDNLLQGF